MSQPTLRHIANLWTLMGHPSPDQEWSLEEKLEAIKAAGFDGVCWAGSPELHEGCRRHGLIFIGGMSSGKAKEFPALLADLRKYGAHHVNVQLADDDTPADESIRLARAVMTAGHELGLEPAIELHRDTCTETPEKLYALADAYQRETGQLMPISWDFSHAAVVKHLVPDNYVRRLLVRPDLVQRAQQFHFRPFNGHHCQVPVSAAGGGLTPEVKDWLPFAEAVLQCWLEGNRNTSREIFVCPEMGPLAGGYNLSVFPGSWSDAKVLRVEIERLWQKVRKALQAAVKRVVFPHSNSLTCATMSLITPTHKKLYEDEGYMILPGVIPKDMLEMLREECSYYLGYYDSILDAKGVQSEGITHRGKRYFINNRYRLSNRLWEFIFSPLMAQVAEATVGPDAYLFHEQWVVKGAEQGMKFSWHQDSGYVKWYDPTTNHKPYVTCWCTLDDVSEVNGTVYLLPHSRAGTKDKIIDHKKEEGSNDLIGYFGSDPGDPVIVPAGSVVAFTSYVFHRSGPNTTNRMRRIYLPQYSGAPINRPDGKPWAMATPFLKGGKIVYDHAADTPANWGPFPEKK